VLAEAVVPRFFLVGVWQWHSSIPATFQIDRHVNCAATLPCSTPVKAGLDAQAGLLLMLCETRLTSKIVRMNKHHAETSKFLSFVLRHRPDAIGIALDIEGWVNLPELIAAAANNGKELDRDLIHAMIATSEKKRFAISEDGLRIRAVQGHSTESVDINYVEKVPPEFLYHGTATRFMESIRKDGLLPGSRQYVHLSQDETTALAVGQRHGKPVVLTIKALLMHEQGFKFFQAENGVWLVELVPAAFTTE
jgi:putative RNA 2'-phosphotransferase